MYSFMGILAFAAAFIGLLMSAPATMGISVIISFYAMFKVIHCFKMYELQKELIALGKKQLTQQGVCK